MVLSNLKALVISGVVVNTSTVVVGFRAELVCCSITVVISDSLVVNSIGIVVDSIVATSDSSVDIKLFDEVVEILE